MSLFSPSASSRASAQLLLALAFGLLPTAGLESQVVADPILAGRVLVADSAVTSGMVVLHHLNSVTQGEIDSVAVARDGSFVLRLPRVPDPLSNEMYFASIRHDGVMYFGNAITVPVDLDSLYIIQAYDTLLAPVDGVSVALEVRSVIFEPSGTEWAVMDVFQLRNDRERTVVPSEDGRVWSYPLPPGARDLAAENEMSPDVVGYENGELVFRAALPPGERFLVVRYFLDSLAVTIPTPGDTEVLQVLVREPAPSIAVEGLTQGESAQIGEATYRLFVGENVVVPQLRITMTEESAPPPVEWIAALLALVLAGGALVALRGGASAAPARAKSGGKEGRQTLLVSLARLDEQYESEPTPTSARTSEYRRRRAELMERLRSAN